MSAMTHWILGPDGEPKEATESEWVSWLGRDRDGSLRRVAEWVCCGLRVSTVFLPTDHSFGFGGPPVLFELMVFVHDCKALHRALDVEKAFKELDFYCDVPERGNGADLYQARFTSRREALAAHEALTVRIARAMGICEADLPKVLAAHALGGPDAATALLEENRTSSKQD